MNYHIAKGSTAVTILGRAFAFARATEVSDVGSADVVLLGVDTITDLVVELEALGAKAQRTVIVGAFRSLSYISDRRPGSLEHALDTLRPLGLFNTQLTCFIGPKTANNYHLAFASAHYGLWITAPSVRELEMLTKVQ